jgi:hypothetical protein
MHGDKDTTDTAAATPVPQQDASPEAVGLEVTHHDVLTIAPVANGGSWHRAGTDSPGYREARLAEDLDRGSAFEGGVAPASGAQHEKAVTSMDRELLSQRAGPLLPAGRADG